MLWLQREIRLPLAHHRQVNCGLSQTYNRNREHELLFLGPVCVVQLCMAWKCQRVFSVCWESSRSVCLLLNKLKSNANLKGYIFFNEKCLVWQILYKGSTDVEWHSHLSPSKLSVWPCQAHIKKSNQTRATEQGSHMVVKMHWIIKKKLERLLNKLHQDRQISFKFFLMSRGRENLWIFESWIWHRVYILETPLFDVRWTISIYKDSGPQSFHLDFEKSMRSECQLVIKWIDLAWWGGSKADQSQQLSMVGEWTSALTLAFLFFFLFSYLSLQLEQ